MPGFDGTGPAGKGPMTGRGMGYCVVPLKTRKDEKVFLENQARILRDELKQLESKIEAIVNSESEIRV